MSRTNRRFFTPLLVVLISVFITFTGSTTSQAQSNNVKLNGTLAPGGSVFDYKISPDGRTVVYRADQETDDIFELYSVPIGGGTPQKLNPTFQGSFHDVYSFEISPDSTTVVYRADQDTVSVRELYSVPIGGGTSQKLNPTFPDNDRDVFSGFQVSPDSTTVVYQADQDTDNVAELYRVPIGGGNPQKLNPTFPDNNRDVLSFQISPDGTTVVYIADQDIDDALELYSVPIGGGTSQKLNVALPNNVRFVSDYKINPNGSTVVYIASQDADEVLELYSVPIGGGTPQKLNSTFPDNFRDVFSFQISPDGNTVVYRAEQDTNNVRELYSVPIGGGTPQKLNPTFPDNDRDVFSGFQVSPDSTTVVYLADQDTDNVSELYRVPIGGGTPQKLSPTFPDINRDVFSLQISPDGNTVVYIADQDIDEVLELYSVPIGGGMPVKLNPTFPDNRDVFSGFQISSDSTTVVYGAGQDTNQDTDRDTDEVLELYSVPIDPPRCQNVTVTTQQQLEAAIVDYNTNCTDGQTLTVTVSGTITLASALSQVNIWTTAELIIQGDGDDAISGADSFRILDVNAGNVTIETLTLQNGRNTQILRSAGGIYIATANATVTINNSTLTANQASIAGAIEVLGGTLNVTNSTFSGNVAANSTSSTIRATGGGQVTIVNSTFVNNRAALGTTLEASDANTNVTITNSTFFNNIVNDVGIGGLGSGGVQASNSATITLNNTILARSTNSNAAAIPDCLVAPGGVINFSPGTSNIIENGSECGTPGVTFIQADPLLGALANNGGSVQTLALLPGSPAINAGDNTTAVDASLLPLTTDGRGTGFPRISGGLVDIGAFEYSFAAFPTDVNADGIVSPADAVYVINRIGQTKDSNNATADVNNDGNINQADADLVIAAIGSSAQ